MSVLDDPEAGGATVWPYVGVNIFPEKGSSIWWFNTKSDSVPDPETKHAACPVLLGQKWSKFLGCTAILAAAQPLNTVNFCLFLCF